MPSSECSAGSPFTGYVALGIGNLDHTFTYEHFKDLGFWRNPIAEHQISAQYSYLGKAIYRAPLFQAKLLFNFEVYIPLSVVRKIRQMQFISQERAIGGLDPSLTLIDAFNVGYPVVNYAVLITIPPDFGSTIIGSNGQEAVYECSFTCQQL